MVRINGQLMKQEDVDPELFRKLLEEKIDFAMGNIGFEKDKTAQAVERKDKQREVLQQN